MRRDTAPKTFPIGETKRIALVAHDNKKRELVEWARFNRELLARHRLYATGHTGRLLEEELDIRVVRHHIGSDRGLRPRDPVEDHGVHAAPGVGG